MNKYGLSLFLTSIPGLAAGAYPEGSPPGYTGGFGRPTCTECHFDQPAKPGLTAIQIKGIGQEYTRRTTYSIRLKLDHPGVRRAGFQLAVSDQNGAPAGILAIQNDRLEVIDGYLRTTDAGSRKTDWQFQWTAPDYATGEILVHIAANAGNDDDSPFGDTIYLRTLRLIPAH